MIKWTRIDNNTYVSPDKVWVAKMKASQYGSSWRLYKNGKVEPPTFMSLQQCMNYVRYGY